MKPIRILLLVGFVMLSYCAICQDPDSSDVQYDFELTPTGELSSTSDTIYAVYFSIDTADLNSFKRLTVLGDEKQKIFSVKAEDIATDPRFVISGDKYIFNTEEWSGIHSWTVKGKKHDDSEVALTSKKEKEKVIHKVIKESKSRDLKLNTDTTNPDEE